MTAITRTNHGGTEKRQNHYRRVYRLVNVLKKWTFTKANGHILDTVSRATMKHLMIVIYWKIYSKLLLFFALCLILLPAEILF